jgi:hypothetical protein
MMRRLAAVAVLSALAFPAAARGDGADHATVPVSFTTWSQCPEDGGEQVAFEGVMHLTHTFVTDPAGGYREHFQATIHLDGVGLESGDRYVANGASSLGGTYPAGGMAIVSDVEHFHTIRAGETTPDDDYTSTILLTPGGSFVEQEGCS